MTLEMQAPTPTAVKAGRVGSKVNWGLTLQRVLALIIILALWQVAVVVGLLPSITPGVIEVFGAIGAALTMPTFWAALGQTLTAATTGWLISCVVGVTLGLLIGTIRPLDRSTSVVVEFGRAFPTIALMPVVMLMLGATMTMEVTMVVLASVWPVLVQAILGSRRLDPAIVDTVQIFRIPRALWFRRVLLPSAMPFIATGIRISASISILAAVGVEVLTQVPGLGRLITLAQEAQRWDMAFAYLFFAGLFGWGIATLLAWGEKSLLAWNRQSDD
ncbi:ABC transporter permease [Mycetocola zhadangensis]|uniref:ABC transporter permease subunit n=1 Tax=Mycetocola zhadangensis TaxID=1164595 RepID=A0A3L7IWK0_9MICO|nr:ABC transporter permease subunit [Mycetocola zhadangensis]RLQ82587.1 ABC transporter permease subunit [Mycetocola zhadangensis]GGF00048.1 nitrate ABC transporter permease [Mycetocola zhadangensis]